MTDEYVPLVCGYLTCIGDERDGCTFHVIVEGDSGATALMRGDIVRSPWLRALCSCGWVADDVHRYTIEENAHHFWLTTHVGRKGIG